LEQVRAAILPLARVRARSIPEADLGRATDRGAANTPDRAQTAARQVERLRAMPQVVGTRRELEAVPAQEQAPHLFTVVVWASVVPARKGKARADGAAGLAVAVLALAQALALAPVLARAPGRGRVLLAVVPAQDQARACRATPERALALPPEAAPALR
jgi:hypothetical protein